MVGTSRSAGDEALCCCDCGPPMLHLSPPAPNLPTRAPGPPGGASATGDPTMKLQPILFGLLLLAAGTLAPAAARPHEGHSLGFGPKAQNPPPPEEKQPPDEARREKEKREEDRRKRERAHARNLKQTASADGRRPARGPEKKTDEKWAEHPPAAHRGADRRHRSTWMSLESAPTQGDPFDSWATLHLPIARRGEGPHTT